MTATPKAVAGISKVSAEQHPTTTKVQILPDGEFYPPVGEANGRVALVLHEAPGITGNVRRRCAMLAEQGYAAFAPDLHRSGRALGPEGVRQAMAAFRAEPQLLRDRVNESLDRLCALAGATPHQVAVIGYCFGGMAALELARSGAKVAAIASFHGLLLTSAPAREGQVHTPVLAMTGGLDEFVPPQDVLAFQNEMTAAKAPWELIVYGRARHSFTNIEASIFGDDRMRHDPSADQKSWAALLDFLETAYA